MLLQVERLLRFAGRWRGRKETGNEEGHLTIDGLANGDGQLSVRANTDFCAHTSAPNCHTASTNANFHTPSADGDTHAYPDAITNANTISHANGNSKPGLQCGVRH